MTIALPPPGKQTSENHVEISHRFLEHAQNELNKGNRLQASEKVWGSMSHALKAIAEKRGWSHPDHPSSVTIADQLGREFGRRRQFNAWIVIGEAMHQNFYRNMYEVDTIQDAIEDAKLFVAALDQVRNEPPRAYTIMTDSDQNRIGRLLDIPVEEREVRLVFGKMDTQGFSQFDASGFPRNPLDDEDKNGENGSDGSSSPVKRPPPPGPDPKPTRGRGQSGEGTQAQTPAKSRSRGTPAANEPLATNRAMPPTNKRPKSKMPQQPKPVFPKVSTSGGRSTRSAPAGFNPLNCRGKARDAFASIQSNQEWQG